MRAIDSDELYRAKFHGVAEIVPPDEHSAESYKRGWNDAIDAIADKSCTPTIEPERKRGRWIIKDNPGTGWYRVTCSECGEDVTSTAPCIGFYPNAKVTWDYCPNCGAKMVEDDPSHPFADDVMMGKG